MLQEKEAQMFPNFPLKVAVAVISYKGTCFKINPKVAIYWTTLGKNFGFVNFAFKIAQSGLTGR